MVLPDLVYFVVKGAHLLAQTPHLFLELEPIQ